MSAEIPTLLAAAAALFSLLALLVALFRRPQPTRDPVLEAAAAAGVTAVIQPGGSIRDAEVIAAADKAGLAMVFTGMRHFRH